MGKGENWKGGLWRIGVDLRGVALPCVRPVVDSFAAGRATCLLKFKEPIAEDWWRGDIG